MVQSIDKALITQFSDLVHHDAQQLTSRLKPYVQMKQMTGDVFAYDGLGRVDAREVNGRIAPADFDDIEHRRRKIPRRRFVINLPVDSSDVRGALLDPDSEYSKSVAAGMMRQMDRVVTEAAFADVQTGRDFENTTTFAADGGLEVDATGGLTYAKMLEIQENFIDNDVGLDADEKLYLTIGGRENTSLLQETELTSGDFTRQMSVDKGKMIFAAGHDLIHFASNAPRPIIQLNGAGTERELIAASNRAICVGVSKEMSINIQERNDLIETHQVQVIMQIGAVRTEGELIQKVRVTA